MTDENRIREIQQKVSDYAKVCALNVNTDVVTAGDLIDDARLRSRDPDVKACDIPDEAYAELVAEIEGWLSEVRVQQALNAAAATKGKRAPRFLR